MAEYIERERIVMGVLGLTIVDPMVAQYADAVLLQIKQAPAADVAPVVRCKDCIHYWKNKNTPGYLDKCVTVSDDDYCSDGKRKDGE